MSQPLTRNPDNPHALIPFGDELMDRATEIARASERGRTVIRLHEHEEPVQRMLNAIEPQSYVRPHRHTGPHKHEVVVALRGSVLVARFGEDGSPLEGYVVAAAGPTGGVEV